MSSFNHLGKTLSNLGSRNPDSIVDQSKKPELHQRLEKLALFLAETWKDEHEEAHSDPDVDLNDCITYVTVEMAEAATSVGGPVGLEILTGGGSMAACLVCRQVLSSPSDASET
jgi:hypothetical protein